MIGAAPHAVEIEGLGACRGGVAVLEDITLTVRAGETFGLLGSDGAGKTSLLRSILMLLRPRTGTVRLFGEPHDRPSARARLAYLPERFQPPGHLTGHDFVRLTLAFHAGRVSRARTAALAEQLDLDPAALKQPIRGYAKAATQTLGLLAMLLTDLPLLVLDEPLSGLPPKARLLLKRQLAACRARGRTILLSSPVAADHDQLCDRIAILHGGRLTDLGTPGELQAWHTAPTLQSAFLRAIERPPLLPTSAS